MKSTNIHVMNPRRIAVAAVTSVLTLLAVHTADAQCEEITSGLLRPIGITQSNQGNLIVSETGNGMPGSGRISIVDLNGNRRTLLAGLPSGLSDVGDPSGPDGIFMRGRTLYVAIGTGDAGRPGPLPGTTIPNPNPVTSPIYSSILAIHFSANVERTTNGFTLTEADQQALANGQAVALGSRGGDKIQVEMIVDFPNYISFPLPFYAPNVQLSNPFGLAAVGDDLFVSDGGRNGIWKIDLLTRSYSLFASFPSIPNPAFPTFGGPMLDAVPTGITYANGQLLVTLLRGFPFPPGTSVVEQIDPVTGAHAPFISGLRTAIGVLPTMDMGLSDYLVLQHTSGTTILPPFVGSGVLLRFATPTDPPAQLANCLTRPTSMTLEKRKGRLYVTELGGRIVAIPLAP